MEVFNFTLSKIEKFFLPLEGLNLLVLDCMCAMQWYRFNTHVYVHALADCAGISIVASFSDRELITGTGPWPFLSHILSDYRDLGCLHKHQNHASKVFFFFLYVMDLRLTCVKHYSVPYD